MYFGQAAQAHVAVELRRRNAGRMDKAPVPLAGRPPSGIVTARAVSGETPRGACTAQYTPAARVPVPPCRSRTTAASATLMTWMHRSEPPTACATATQTAPGGAVSCERSRGIRCGAVTQPARARAVEAPSAGVSRGGRDAGMAWAWARVVGRVWDPHQPRITGDGAAAELLWKPRAREHLLRRGAREGARGRRSGPKLWESASAGWPANRPGGQQIQVAAPMAERRAGHPRACERAAGGGVTPRRRRSPWLCRWLGVVHIAPRLIDGPPCVGRRRS
jgi:hypothetical protein